MRRLTAERVARKWSKAELARRAGMNDATIGQIERGILQPYPIQVDKLAEALGWPHERRWELIDEVGV